MRTVLACRCRPRPRVPSRADEGAREYRADALPGQEHPPSRCPIRLSSPDDPTRRRRARSKYLSLQMAGQSPLVQPAGARPPRAGAMRVYVSLWLGDGPPGPVDRGGPTYHHTRPVPCRRISWTPGSGHSRAPCALCPRWRPSRLPWRVWVMEERTVAWILTCSRAMHGR